MAMIPPFEPAIEGQRRDYEYITEVWIDEPDFGIDRVITIEIGAGRELTEEEIQASVERRLDNILRAYGIEEMPEEVEIVIAHAYRRT